MRSRTTSLFHFTKSLENLQFILKEGFRPHYCLESYSWMSSKIVFSAIPLVSFCDIPLSRIEQHTTDYKNYGIALKREWGISKRLNPIVYIPENSTFCRVLLETLNSPSRRNPFALTQRNHILSHTKPMSVMRGDKKIDFYKECEWRYVPLISDPNKQFLTEKDFKNQENLEKANEDLRIKYMLNFEFSDIKHLIVNSMTDIPDFIDYIENKLDRFSDDERKILLTKIFTLGEVLPDI